MLSVIGFARVGFVALAAVWLWLALAVFPAGLFSVDEFYYAIGADQLLRSGSLIAGPAATLGASPDLSLPFLVDGPHGFAVQYPHGYMILAAPLAALMGLKGFMLLNTLAALGTVALTWRLGREILGDAKSATLAAAVLALASWLPDYAFAVWPHATATFFAMLAITLFHSASAREAADAPGGARLAAVAGFVGGVALTMRADAVLAAAALAIWAPAFAARPVRLMLWGTAGAILPLLGASWLNLYKFGVFFPISYGSSGAQSVSGHLSLAPVGLLVIAALIALRNPRVRTALAGRGLPIGLGALAVLVLAVLLVPALRIMAARFATGFETLIVDLQNFTGWRSFPSIVRDEHGYLVFFEIYKKALGQSLPWIALILAALPLLLRERLRPGIALCLIVIVVWVLPFMPNQWHGGLSNNLRYFTPFLPFAAILFAAGWNEVSKWAEAGGWRQAPAALLALALLAVSYRMGAEAGIPPITYAEITLSKQLFLGLAAVTAVCLVLPLARPWLAQAARLMAMLALGLGFLVSQVNDVVVNYASRARAAAITEANADIPGDSMLYTYRIESFVDYFMRPDTLLARPAKYGKPVDQDFVRRELDAGRRVFALGEMVRDQVVEGAPDLVAGPLLSEDPAAPRYEITRR